MNPAAGCVAPHTLTTGVPTIEARCMLALSMESIRSRWLISISSCCMASRWRLTLTHRGSSAHHLSNVRSSSWPRPNRNSLAEGNRPTTMPITWRIRRSGYTLPWWAANGAMPIHCS